MTIKCAVELGRRAARNIIDPGSTIISCPSDVAEYLGEEMQYLEMRRGKDSFLLNAGNKVLRL
jgi:DNA repair protein RadC